MALNELENDIAPTNYLDQNEEVGEPTDPLTLDKVDDDKLAEVIDKRINDSISFFASEYNLYDRRKLNETYLFGRQIAEREKDKKLKIYEARYLDNVIYEIEASIKPLAMSRLPDLIVTPGTEGEEQAKTAEDVGKIIDTDIKNRENRTALGIGFKHLPVYFTGVLKVRWVPMLNDFKFTVVHPEYIEIDHTCQTNDADDMTFVAETLPITIQECKIRFPKKWEKLKKELEDDSSLTLSKGTVDEKGDITNKGMATQIKITEVWFDWQEPKKGENDEEEYEETSGVLWKYKDVILGKMKNPNYDWEGETKYYSYQEPGDKSTRKEIGQDDVMNYMMTGQTPPNMSREQVFRNYFDRPRKPYFFMGYDQWRKTAYDETSRIEQNIKNQMAIDTTGKRIIEKLNGRTKHIWSKIGGLQAKELEKLDLDDPKQDVLLSGDVRMAHAAITPEPVTPQEFNNLDSSRDRMYGLAGAKGIRGELQSDVATTNQIAREADFTRADDIVEDTINAACEWMGDWSLQFIKLRYTDTHFRKMLGDKGSITFMKLKGDMIEDGMEVRIKASGTDKLKTKNQAMDMAKLQMIDPLSFYQDLGVSDPVGRVDKLMAFQANPADYMARFVMKLGDNAQELGQTLNGTAPMAPPPVQPVPPQVPVDPLSQVNGQAPTPQPVPSIPQIPSGSPRAL